MRLLGDVLASEGYKLVDDAWVENGRRTYLHDDDATRDFLIGLARELRVDGWVPHENILRAFRHPVTNEIIEVEPGGADTSGHLLHHMKID